MSQPPVIFSQKAATSPKGGGYPIQISAADLDKNFTYATLDIPEEVQGRPQPFSVDNVTGPGGHSQRRLVFRPPAPSQDAVFSVSGGSLAWIQAPGGEKKVLSARNQQIEWSDSEIPDGTVTNELLRWNGDKWEPFGRGSTDGQLIVANGGGWIPFQSPPQGGTHVLGAVGGELQWIATEEC